MLQNIQREECLKGVYGQLNRVTIFNILKTKIPHAFHFVNALSQKTWILLEASHDEE